MVSSGASTAGSAQSCLQDTCFLKETELAEPAPRKELSLVIGGGQNVSERRLSQARERACQGNTREAARSSFTAVLTLPISEPELSKQTSEM